MPRSNAPPSARVCCFASSPAGSGRSHSLAPYERRARRETTRRQPNDSSRTRRRRPARATGRARPLASAAPARSSATIDRPAPRRRPDEIRCEDSPATPPGTARAYAAAPGRSRGHRRSEPQHGRVRASRRLPRARLRTYDRSPCHAAPAHDRRIGTSPRKRRKVKSHRRRTGTHGGCSRPARPRLRRRRLVHHTRNGSTGRAGRLEQTMRARTRARHAQRCQPQPECQRGDPKTAPQRHATCPHMLHDSQLCYKEPRRASSPRPTDRATRPFASTRPDGVEPGVVASRLPVRGS